MLRENRATLLAVGTLAAVAVILTRNVWLNGLFTAGVDPPDYIMRLLLLGGKSLSWYFASWYPFKSLGHIYLNLSLYDLFTQVFASLNAVLAWKVIYYVLMPMSAGVGMFLFLRRHKMGVGVAWAGSLFYLLNPYFLNYLIIGALFEVTYYSMAPLLLYFWSRVLEERRFWIMLFASVLTGFYVTSISPYVQLSFLPFLVGYLVVAIAWSPEKRSKILTCLLVFLPSAALSLPFALNILTYARATSFFGNPFFSNPNIVAAYSYNNILGALLLVYPVFVKGSFLYSFTGQDPWYHVTDPPWAAGIIAPLVLLVILSPYLARHVKQKRWLYFFFLVAAVSVYLSTGPNPPFPGLFTILYNTLPLFGSLRSFLRYGAISAFAFSFLIAISLQAIIPRLERRNLSVRNPFSSSRQKFGITIFLLYLAVAGILLASAVGNFNMAYPATVSPPSSYVQPFQYLADQQSTTPFRAAVIPFEFRDLTPSWAGRTSDFGGFFGSVISHVPVVQYNTLDLEVAPDSFILLSYLRQLELSNASNRWAMLTGELTNSKYVVVQTYASQWERSFINNQTGLTPSAAGENWTVYNDSYFRPYVTSSDGRMVIFGGLSSLLGLTFVNGSNNYAKFFANQMNPSSISSLFSSRNASFLVYNTDLFDFEMHYADNLTDYTVPLWKYAASSLDSRYAWTETLNATSQGLLTYNSFTAATSSKEQLTVPFECYTNCSEPRLIMLRAEFAPKAGSVSLYLNGVQLGNASLQAAEPTFGWVTFGPVSLLQGKYSLTFVRSGGGAIDLDELSILRSSRLGMLSSVITNLTDRFSFDYVNSVDALQWSSTLPSGCSAELDLDTRSGEYVAICSGPAVLDRQITVPRDGDYTISFRGKGTFNASVLVDGQRVSWEHSSAVWGESQSPPFYLSVGSHNSQLQILNASSIDSITLSSNPTINRKPLLSSGVGAITQIDPGHYSVNLNLPAGSFVLFHESFSPDWVLRAAGLYLVPLEESFAFNAYHLPKAVNGTVDLYFVYRDSVTYDWTVAFGLFSFIMIIELVFIHRKTLGRYLKAQASPSIAHASKPQRGVSEHVRAQDHYVSEIDEPA